MAAFTLRGLICIVITCFLLLAPTSEAAITCGTVIGALGSCVPYVLGSTPIPNGACCGGARTLYSATRTPADRKTVCGCLKAFAGGIPGVNYGLVNSVPKKCGVILPYVLSPSIDCSRIP